MRQYVPAIRQTVRPSNTWDITSQQYMRQYVPAICQIVRPSNTWDITSQQYMRQYVPAICQTVRPSNTSDSTSQQYVRQYVPAIYARQATFPTDRFSSNQISYCQHLKNNFKYLTICYCIWRFIISCISFVIFSLLPMGFSYIIHKMYFVSSQYFITCCIDFSIGRFL